MISLLPNRETKHRVPERCVFCHYVLVKPFIECVQCPGTVLLCLNCFALGREIENHQNTHSYRIAHDNIQVFSDTNWTAKEEKLLLEFIDSFGYNNWDDVSKAINTRSSKECEEHYNKFYFDGIFRKLLGLTNEVYRPIRTPYFFDLNSNTPPRTNKSDVMKHMAGYRAARGDFDIPYDISAESILTDLDGCFYGDWLLDLKHIGETLQCAMLTAYYHRLR